MLFAGKSITTSKGELTFDKDGACMVEDETADAFKDIRGFAVENDSENNNKTDNVEGDKISGDDVNTPETDSSLTEDADEDKNIDLDALSVPSLKKYAKEHEIDITGLNTKEPILKAIKEAIQK